MARRKDTGTSRRVADDTAERADELHDEGPGAKPFTIDDVRLFAKQLRRHATLIEMIADGYEEGGLNEVRLQAGNFAKGMGWVRHFMDKQLIATIGRKVKPHALKTKLIHSLMTEMSSILAEFKIEADES